MKYIIYRILLLVCILLIAINILSSFDLSFFGIRVYRIASGSMEPNLNINDLVIVKRNSEYLKGDIITYRKDNEYITHRIVSIDHDDVITKGDSNNVNDEPFKYNNIVGKVIFRFKYFGFICYLFSKPLSLIAIFIIGLLLTISIPDKKKQNNGRS